MIYTALVAIPPVKLAHHDLTEDAVMFEGLSANVARSLEDAIKKRWFDAISEALRLIGFRPTSVNRDSFVQLLGEDESIVATCLDASYYTFATSGNAADRMYLDQLKLRKVRRLVTAGGDAYRDVTLLTGQSLGLIDSRLGVGPRRMPDYAARMRSILSISDVESVKRDVLARFQQEFVQTMRETVPAPTLLEADVLGRFQERCLNAVSRTVLHLQ